MFGPGLSRWEIRLDRTCLSCGPDMSGQSLWNLARGPVKLLDRSNRSDRCSIPVWPVWQILAHYWNLVLLHHSWKLSWFWALWFCQDHHVASLFVVQWPILKREVKHIRINLSLSTWFFFVPFSSLSKLEGINMILTWAALPWADNNGSLHYMIKTSLLIHVTSSLWFDRYWNLEPCNSPWLIWYLRFKHPVALLHHIRYLDAKTAAYSSLMYGSS
jgi:hypothetical protein